MRIPALASIVILAGAADAAAQQVLFGVAGTGQAWTGFSMVAPGDLDGDGRPELVIGSPLDSTAADLGGLVRVWSSATGQMLWSTFGTIPGERLGRSLGIVGDVNGDGVTDVVAGTYYSSNPGLLRVLSGANGAQLFEFQPQTGPSFGRRCDGAGDVDLDGFPDVVGSAADEFVPGKGHGKVFVCSGQSGALLQTLMPPGPSTFEFGTDVAGVGDWNQDGAGDFAVIRLELPQDLVAGFVDVIGGIGFAPLTHLSLPVPPTSGFLNDIDLVGDVDGDLVSDLGLSALTQSYGGGFPPPQYSGGYAILRGGSGAILSAAQDATTFGFGSEIEGIGDVNGDGAADVAVSTGTVEYGSFVSIRSGSDAAELMRIPGAASFGSGLAGVGDWDGDGARDLAIGTPFFGVDSPSDPPGYAGVYSLTGPPACGTIASYGLACGEPAFESLTLSGAGCVGAGGPLDLDFWPVAGPPFVNGIAFLAIGHQPASIPISGTSCRLLVGPPPVILGGPLPLVWPWLTQIVGHVDAIVPPTLAPGTFALQVIAGSAAGVVTSNGLLFTVP